MIAFNILNIYRLISSFFYEKNIEVVCVIILFHYLDYILVINGKQIICVAKILVDEKSEWTLCDAY